MFGIGSTELAIILVFAFLLFGPDKMPQMGRTIGRALRQFRETQEKLTSVVQSEVVDPMTAAMDAPTKPKKAAADDDADADADVEEGAEQAPAKKETFAERRARLAAEKAEAELAAAREEDADVEDAAEGDSAEGAAGAAEPTAEVEAEADAADAEEAAEVKATADLYARRPRKHKAAVAEAEPEIEQEPAAEAEPASVPAPEADAAEPTAAEEGGEQ